MTVSKREAEFTAIKDGLHLLRTTKSALKVFGAKAHRFLLHPPLSEQTVRDFEVRHHITLPSDYRDFLILIGNGGAGPAYGLFKLDETDDGVGHRTWGENDWFVGVLSQPFPHTDSWNDLSQEPVYDESREDDPEWEDEYQRKLDQWEDQVYWSPATVNGAIPICHLGCAYRQWLVVTGSEAGNVWNDNRTDHGGLEPLRHGRRRRVTFLQWYHAWLDEALQQSR